MPFRCSPSTKLINLGGRFYHHYGALLHTSLDFHTNRAAYPAALLVHTDAANTAASTHHRRNEVADAAARRLDTIVAAQTPVSLSMRTKPTVRPRNPARQLALHPGHRPAYNARRHETVVHRPRASPLATRGEIIVVRRSPRLAPPFLHYLKIYYRGTLFLAPLYPATNDSDSTNADAVSSDDP